MNSDSKGTQSMQFDTAVPRGTTSDGDAAQQGVSCAVCRRGIADEYFDVNGQSVCAPCRDRLAQEAVPPRGWMVLARPALYGFAAAILGAILYYAVIAITDFEIGIVAIAIGYMVGYAVRAGAGGKGGRRFQVMALVLTYWSVGLAYTPLVFQGMAEQSTQEAETQAAPASASVTVTADVAPESAAEAGGAPGSINLSAALAVLTGLSLALPVLSVATSLPGGLISAAIIAFGMQQAWRMTGAPQLKITGPYRIAGASA